jgi:hypothetical protein
MSTDKVMVETGVDVERFRSDTERVVAALRTGERPFDDPVRQSVLARELGVSSGQIDTWRNRARANGFPDPVACNIGPVHGGGKRRHMLWDLAEVRAWFSTYNPTDQRARRGPAQLARKAR